MDSSDHALLIRMLETQAEMKAMLGSALEKQVRTDQQVEALNVRVKAIELNEARQKGRTQLIGTVSGAVAGFGTGIGTAILAPYLRAKIGF